MKCVVFVQAIAFLSITPAIAALRDVVLYSYCKSDAMLISFQLALCITPAIYSCS